MQAQIWTLQEHDLLEETPEGFILKYNPELEELYTRYMESGPETEPQKTETAADDGVQRKEILYINPEGEDLNLMMKCLVSGNSLMKTIDELGSLIPSIKKCMILRDDDYFELLIELIIENRCFENVLGALEEMNWEKRAPKNN